MLVRNFGDGFGPTWQNAYHMADQAEAEAYFRKGQNHRAIIAFNQVAVEYPKGDRAPAALLRESRIREDQVIRRIFFSGLVGKARHFGHPHPAARPVPEKVL